MRTSEYQNRLKDEVRTPKSVVVEKYPHATARRIGNDPERKSDYNRWGVYETAEKGSRLLGSVGTTATAWGTAAKAIWREDRRNERKVLDRQTMEYILQQYEAMRIGRVTLLRVFEQFVQLQDGRSSITDEEFIEFLREKVAP